MDKEIINYMKLFIGVYESGNTGFSDFVSSMEACIEKMKRNKKEQEKRRNAELDKIQMEPPELPEEEKGYTLDDY